MEGVSAIGIDIGSKTTVIATVKKGGIEIILNESSGRETPSIISYSEKGDPRLIGEPAMNQIKGNFKNTLNQFYRFMGLNTETPQLEEEKKFDLVTALAGSGPGFVYRFIDALAEAGRELGLEEAQATSLALSMVEGASSLAAKADVSPDTLADQVASPGGMTREGLNVLDADKALVKLLTRTLDATAKRGTELSAGAG